MSGTATIGLLVKRFPKLSETFVLEEVLGLERLGVRLRLYTLAPPSDALVHPDVARVGAPVVQVPAAGWRLALAQLRLALTQPRRWAQALAEAARRGAWGDCLRAGWLACRLRDDGCAHLHAHFISQPADIAQLASRMSGMPFSISAHAKDIYLSRPEDLARRMAAARFTVTCTEFNRRTLAAIAPQATVRRMYHGVDATRFHPCRRAVPTLVPMLLSVGRLVPKKGLDTLVAACALLRERGCTFRCEIVGYGAERDALAAQIAALGLDDQVTLAGTLTREHVLDRYARAAVYVQPSRVAADGDRDGIPNVLLEAMALGLPVVATQVSGIPELVTPGRNGLLVEPDDPAALADAIQRVLADPVLAAALGRAARAGVTEHFDNDRNLHLLLQLLENRDACLEPAAA